MAEGGAGPGASPETRRVIHELRQPLAALQMWVDLLGESLEGQLGEAQERYLAKVRAEVGRIARVLAASAAGGLVPAPVEGGARDALRESRDEARRNAAGAGQGSGALAGLVLVVVEDDEMTAEALQLALEAEGARVSLASTVADGLASFRDVVPDGVLSDLRISDGDGLALVREIRRLEQGSGRSAVAIAVTGFDSRETRLAARDAGFDETVTKPFGVDALVATVARLVAARRSPGA